MAKQSRYSPEVKERAVRLLREQRAHYDTEWAAISSIAIKMGCRRKRCGSGCVARRTRCGRATGCDHRGAAATQAPEAGDRELRRANEILRKAAAYFAQAELDRRGT